MENGNKELEQKLKLSAQRALLGCIPTSLRSASFEYKGTEIACRFIFNGTVSYADKELLSCAATEIIADYSSPYTISEEYLDVSCPGEMEYLTFLVFLRYEPKCNIVIEA